MGQVRPQGVGAIRTMKNKCEISHVLRAVFQNHYVKRIHFFYEFWNRAASKCEMAGLFTKSVVSMIGSLSSKFVFERDYLCGTKRAVRFQIYCDT